MRAKLVEEIGKHIYIFNLLQNRHEQPKAKARRVQKTGAYLKYVRPHAVLSGIWGISDAEPDFLETATQALGCAIGYARG